MKKECLFTPEQKQVVVEYASEFQRFFASRGYLKSSTPSSVYMFRRGFAGTPVQRPAAQLGVLFAYYIITKNYDYFKKNRQHNYQKYLTNIPHSSWCGFAYYIWQSLQDLQSDEEVQIFFEELHEQIILKYS